MPIYEFQCESCGHPFEELLRSSAHIEQVTCPHCRSQNVRKKISLFASTGGGRAAASNAACTTST